MLENKNFEQLSCMLCGETKSELIGKRGQFGLPTYVSICPRCGLVYLNPRWNKNRYFEFYAKEYDKYYRPQIFVDESKELRYATTKTILDRLNEYNLNSFKSVLDIGCGMGWSLDFIAQRVKGISLAGIESSDYCIDNLVNKVGGELLSNDVDSDWHSDYYGLFDLIIMRGVLEHFLNPISVLKKVHYVLSRNGILYIAVPDMMFPRGELDSYWFRVVHTYYFSKSTLIQTTNKASLTPLKINSENSELWGVFKKGKSTLEFASVYREQIKYINHYQRWRILAFLTREVAMLIAKLIPSSIKAKIPPNLKKKMGRWL